MKMKMRTMGLAVAMATAFSMSFIATSCSDDEDGKILTSDGEEVINNAGIASSKGVVFENGTQIGNGDSEFEFTGNKTLEKGTYLLKGWVYVSNGATLTIPAGTIIKGDKMTKAALIVEPGGKVFAEGTASEPIIFTSAQAANSRKPGDWGGLVICGKAANNQGTMRIEGGPRTEHGGKDDNDNSGIYKYIRVEFAGYPFDTDKEINAVTFGSVGRGTVVDHIQVSYSNDDSFEWFGGTVNCSNLIAYKGWDDDFDTDNGFSGHIQFCLSVRDPRIADTSQSNGFESDNNAGGTDVSPYTNAVFSNVTFIGPMTQKNVDFENTSKYITGGALNPGNGSKTGLFQSAMHIRRSSKLNCYNSVALGWPVGLILDGQLGSTMKYADNQNLKLQNVFFAGMGITGSDFNKETTLDRLAIWPTSTDKDTKPTYDDNKESHSTSYLKSIGIANGCRIGLTEDDLQLGDSKGVGQNYAPLAGSPLLNASSFAGLTSSFLNTNITYVGAFSGTNDTWIDSWTNFAPETTAY